MKRVSIPPTPVPIPDTIRLGAHGVVQDIEEATKRLMEFRKRKRKSMPSIPKQLKIPVNQALAIEMMAVRFAVTDAAIIRKFIEDGIAKYGDDEEREEAGIDEKQESPFEEMRPNVSRETIPYANQTIEAGNRGIWSYGSREGIAYYNPDNELEPIPNGDMRKLLGELPTPFTGLPLGFNNDTEGDGA